ncbi:hypothetical protein ASPCADRAFT_204220 [Aspergillus carbonarius ITEM 5010]|uniref:Uncharacterized protein n=1 Tax=Aspergillus carbonarius (strain ITEM 5010) TaxID=602072 RepID=A0A1R3RVM2_ASPC5|nr:hypothetical protein ASPCADRAFT_204220 [Aspergillus carbonarius ITEM 5010]
MAEKIGKWKFIDTIPADDRLLGAGVSTIKRLVDTAMYHIQVVAMLPDKDKLQRRLQLRETP